MDRNKVFRVVRGIGLILLPLACLAGLLAVFIGCADVAALAKNHFIQLAILANLVIGVLLATLQQEESKDKYELQAYWATLIATGALLPGAVAVITVVIYLAGWAGKEGKDTLLWGSAIAIWAWFVAAFVCRGFADAKNGIPSSYGELGQRLTQLEAKFKGLCPNLDPNKPETFPDDPKMKEATTQIVAIWNELKLPGLSWVLARGYVNVWNRQYRAEEAMIEVAPQETILAEALYDEMRLQGSEIENREDLLAKLRQAVNVIDPGAKQYLKPAATATTPPTISSTSPLRDGVVGKEYNQPLLASGGTTPYSWKVTVGEKPSGLELDERTGLLSGTPQVVKEFSFTVRVTDSASQWAEKPLNLTINDTAKANAPAISTASSLPEITLGGQYNQLLQVAGGTTPYSWKITRGEKPAGLELDEMTGVLKGTPKVAKEFSFTVQVTDSASPPLGTEKPMKLTVNDPAKPHGDTEPKAVARAVLRTVRRSINEYRGQRWNGLIVSRNRLLATMIFTALTTYALLMIAVIRNAPQCAIAAATTVYLVGATFGLCGRLRSESQSGTAVEDYGLSAARLVTIPLFSGLAAIGGVVLVAMAPYANMVFGPTPSPLGFSTTSPLPEGTVNTAYRQSLQATGGTGPYKWEIITGKPDWLELDPKGVLSGRPTKAESGKFTAQVSDIAGATERKEFTLTVQQGESAQAAPGSAATKNPTDRPVPRSQPEKPTPAPAGGAGTTPITDKSVPPAQQGPSTPTPAGSVGTKPPPSLTDIFNLDRYLIALLVAAVFGLTPGLLFDRLQQQAEKYKADLKSSQSTGQATQGAQKT